MTTLAWSSPGARDDEPTLHRNTAADHRRGPLIKVLQEGKIAGSRPRLDGGRALPEDTAQLARHVIHRPTWRALARACIGTSSGCEDHRRCRELQDQGKIVSTSLYDQLVSHPAVEREKRSRGDMSRIQETGGLQSLLTPVSCLLRGSCSREVVPGIKGCPVDSAHEVVYEALCGRARSRARPV